MINIGSMAICAARLMKVVDIDDDIAQLVFIDLDGEVRTRFASVAALTPFWSALMPRSLWPEAGHLDLVEIEKEERAAAAAKKTAKKASRKARRSNKIKRMAA